MLFILGILLIGAVVLVVPISYLGLDPVPGDFTIHLTNFQMQVPVTYSLCASLALGLFYYLLKR